MDYVLACQAPAYRTSESSFLTEGPFGKHLIELKANLPQKYKRLILIGPEMSDSDAEVFRGNGTEIREAEQGIVFIPSHNTSDSISDFWSKRAYGIWKIAKSLFRESSVLHVDIATDIRRPMTAIVARAARHARRPVCFVTDIDFRDHAARAQKLGNDNYPRLALAKLQQHFKSKQVRDAVAHSQLVLLKSPSMVADFGKGAPHVKNFFDVVHSENEILDNDQTEERIRFLRAPARLRLCYFGRLVKYKGVDRMIDAIAVARDMGTDIELRIVGEGPERDGLIDQVARLNLENQVTFRAAASYGPALFGEIGECHAMINAPLREDTPRAAFDAMARGLPILAFDISYFRDLAQQSSAVVVATWPDNRELAKKAIMLSQERGRLADMALNGLKFARENTQPIWLKRRVGWLLEFTSRA